MTGVLFAVFVFLIFLVIANAIPLLWLIAVFIRRRERRVAEEAAQLAAPLPPDRALPRVLVQLPVFNEARVVERAVAALAALDWPRDRLTIQVLDDSTDQTTALARAAVAAARSAGVDATLIHRGARTGFKAGALADGLRVSDAPFVAVFDADYVPPRDWLRKAVRPLLADDRVAFVQSRITYRNRGENALTRAQGVLLDLYYAFEQPARAWAGLPVPFNGTCALWRRAAIEDGGGWSADTLAEDLDLSLAVQAKGWRACLLVTSSVAGELPAARGQWRAQQYRWSKGTIEALAKALRGASRAGAGGRFLLAAATMLADAALPFLIAAALAVGAALLALMGEPSVALAVLVNTAILVQGGANLAAIALSRSLAGRGGGLVRDVATAAWYELSVSASRMRAAASALLGRRSDFQRTEKQGA